MSQFVLMPCNECQKRFSLLTTVEEKCPYCQSMSLEGIPDEPPAMRTPKRKTRGSGRRSAVIG